MRLLAAAVGLVLLTGTVSAQPAHHLTGVRVTSERVFGQLKAVEGYVDGPDTGSTEHNPQSCTVWVNGFSTTPDPAGRFAVMVPNETIATIVAYQPTTKLVVVALGRDAERAKRFENMDPTAIRDLLGGKKPEATVQQGGGDGGIRDLLGKPKATVQQGGGDGGIRDLLNNPKGSTVQQGGGDGGIRDLLNRPKGSTVQQGGGDGGIRDLLGKPKPGAAVQQGGGDGGIRDLLKK